MCGIAGLLHFDPNRIVDQSVVRRMTEVLVHRGPDGDGCHTDKNVGLGHRRLAVIDLSTGDQPMFSEDRKLVIVFNGEIYNYVELREELKSLGHRFATTSDTEVILHAYQEWGFDCQNRFNGMWAFAIWDARQEHLFLSRDRIGEKPLHYAMRDDSFLFGSEIKSILAAGHRYEAATQLLHLYLSFGYIPAPYTFYKGISKLMPGHFLVVKDGNVRELKYWDLPPIDEASMRLDASKVYEEFEHYFSDAVRIRMRSDVPFGAFLSGGLDSSSVVAAMSQESKSPVETFTIGFAEKAFDERFLAKRVADKFHTRHHEQLVDPESFDEALTKVLKHFDEPFGDASALPVGLVSRLARQHVTMVLTGDGGDEVLSGYTTYAAEKFAEQYGRIPAVIRRGIDHSVHLISLIARNSLRYRLNRTKRVLHLSGAPFEERFTSKLARVDRSAIRHLIPGSISQIRVEDFLADFFSKSTFSDPFYRLMYFNLKVSLPDDMLAKVDRMSMAHSLETRVPFLDPRIMELTWRVHKNVKMQGYKLKNVLRQSYGPKLPPELLRAPKKPFSVPLREWFKQRNFEDKLHDLQTHDFGLDSKVISQLVNANASSKEDYGDFIWRLFVLKRWISR